MPLAPVYDKEIIVPPLPVKPGSNGTIVALLQEWLVIRGYDVGVNTSQPIGTKAGVGIDGDYGKGTDTACVNFATDENFTYKGLVDIEFWTKLAAPLVDAHAYVPTARTFGAAVVETALKYLAGSPREARLDKLGALRGLDNSGQWVRQFNHGYEGVGWPWCMGAVAELEDQAARALGISPPVSTMLDGIRCLYVPRVVTEAKRAGTFLGGGAATASAVKPGSMFFVPGTIDGVQSHIHVGIVEEVIGDKVKTLEGNTNHDGSSNGVEFIRRQRTLHALDYSMVP